MLKILVTAMNAVLPIILLSVFGYFLKRRGFINEQFAKIGSKFVFHICLSCTLFINVYNLNDFSAIAWDAVLYCVAIVCLLFVIGLFVAMVATKDPMRRGVLLHSVFRSNFAIIGLSLASALGGDASMAVASVVSAFTIPLYNILGVVSLSIFTGSGNNEFSFKTFVVSILKNPMILGALLGCACIFLRIFQDAILGFVYFTIKDQLAPVYSVLNSLKTMTTPLALIVLGAQFEFSAVRGMLKEIVVGSLMRIVIAPIIGICFAVLLSYTGLSDFGTNTYPTLIAMFGAPVAVSTAVIAAEMGGDEQLATQLVVWTSLGSIFTIYIMVCIMMGTGLLIT